MDKHTIAILIPLFGLSASAVLVGLGMLIRHKERMAGLGAAERPRDPEIEERMARLEQTLDALAEQIERTGEAQRYLTKVLAKHLPAEAQEKLPS